MKKLIFQNLMKDKVMQQEADILKRKHDELLQRAIERQNEVDTEENRNQRV